MMQDYYSWSIYIYLSIHEQGRYLKYESYFTQICMIFFILCLASWMLSYSVVHAGLVLLVAKSHTPFTNWTDLPAPEISIMILHRRRSKQQQQQQQQNRNSSWIDLISRKLWWWWSVVVDCDRLILESTKAIVLILSS